LKQNIIRNALYMQLNDAKSKDIKTSFNIIFLYKIQT